VTWLYKAKPFFRAHFTLDEERVWIASYMEDEA
jgi:hypothetical protein